MTVKDGVLRFEDGSEVTLWGSNFQPNLYWEYKFRMEHLGLPMTAETLQAMCDDGFEDLKRMKCGLIRCHLTPADFTDADGNLIETLWLDMLGYMVAAARKNGVYVSLTFLNHMEYTFIEESFITSCSREEWIFNPECVSRIECYVRQLLNWKNPYTGICLKDDPVIATWEPINEPEYFSHQQMMENPGQRKRFVQWQELNQFPDNDNYYARFRYEVVKNYINRFRRILDEENARQPLIWNCNWPRMIDGRRDVFRAVADSDADAISFCLYPGQDDVSAPFIKHSIDLSDRNYLPFLQHCSDDYDHLGWVKDPRFAGKAKTVYEFEVMYNSECSYLYPAMAKLFRSLGVQMATMWTHCFNIYAPYIGCSHNMNLKTTPKKAAGFIIAGELFRYLPREFEYSTRSATDDVLNGFAFSQDSDSCLESIDKKYISSGDVVWAPVNRQDNLIEITGYGSSPFVTYNGKGLYFISICNDDVAIEVFPHACPVREQWKWYADGRFVTELDYKTELPFEIHLPGREPVHMIIAPGKYHVRCCRISERAAGVAV